MTPFYPSIFSPQLIALNSRGMKVFRKFDEDSPGGGGPVQPRVLFPSARQTHSRASHTLEDKEPTPQQQANDNPNEDGETFGDEDADHFAAIFESDSAPPPLSELVKEETTIEKVKVSVEVETTLETNELQSASEKEAEETEDGAEEKEPENHEDTDNEDQEKVEKEKVETEEQEEEARVEQPAEKPARAPSVAPSVSSIASSNILSFGRRPRITKSVSNLSNGEGHAPLRRSKRLASVEPEQLLPAGADAGKASIKQKLASKRSRSDDSALEDTERWALGVQGGIRKKYRN